MNSQDLCNYMCQFAKFCPSGKARNHFMFLRCLRNDRISHVNANSTSRSWFIWACYPVYVSVTNDVKSFRFVQHKVEIFCSFKVSQQRFGNNSKNITVKLISSLVKVQYCRALMTVLNWVALASSWPLCLESCFPVIIGVITSLDSWSCTQSRKSTMHLDWHMWIPLLVWVISTPKKYPSCPSTF